MSQKILQINYNFTISRSDLEHAFLEAAQPIGETPGLRWKVWLIKEADSEGGGIHLFDDEASLHAYLDGPIIGGMKANPAFGNISVKIFDVLEEHTAITRGPVGDRLASPNGLPKTFGGMAEEAYRVVPTIKPADVQRRQKKEADLLVIDVRDAADIPETGTVPGALNLSLGSLTYLADNEVPEEWRHPQLADRSRPIITTCILGPMGALGGKLLHDMGFADVQVLEGGVQAWIDAGLPVAKNGTG